MANSVRTKVMANEGYSATPYQDSLGVNTVGYGFNTQDPMMRSLLPADVAQGKRAITQQEASDALGKRLQVAIQDAGNFVGKDAYGTMTQPRREALVDMSYQLGAPRLSKFVKMQDALSKGDHVTAADELLNSSYAKQTPSRAYNNAFTILTGQPYDPTVISSYQKANGLKADGVIGPKTWRVLRQQLGAQQ